MHKIILSSVLLILSFNIQAGNRYDAALEYELMDECVGTTFFKRKKIDICVCALEKTESRYSTSVSKNDLEEIMAKNMESCKK
jgi:hypothetical protein